MRRAPIVLAATAAGLAFVLSFRTHNEGPGAAAKRATWTYVPGSRVGIGSGYTPNGPVKLRVTVVGGRIVAIDNLQLPNDNAHSVQLSEVSGPLLHKEAMRAQSANIDAVSGATMTSMAYESSLQAALDKLHIKR